MNKEANLKTDYRKIQVIRYLRQTGESPVDLITALIDVKETEKRAQIAFKMGLTVFELAELTGVTQRTAQRWVKAHKEKLIES